MLQSARKDAQGRCWNTDLGEAEASFVAKREATTTGHEPEIQAQSEAEILKRMNATMVKVDAALAAIRRISAARLKVEGRTA